MMVPKLRFRDENGQEFPGWKEVKLNKILTESLIPGNSGINARKITVKLWAKGAVAKKEHYNGSQNTSYYIRKAGQLIYSKLDFANQAFAIIPDELDGYESTADLPAFDINNSVDSNFLLYQLIQPSFYERKSLLANGGRKAKRINVRTFLSFEVLLPQKAEQLKIADFFSTLDSRIAVAQKKLSALQLLKKSLMQQIFSGKLRFKDENGQEFPEWEIKKLGQLFSERTERNKSAEDKSLLSVTIANGVIEQSTGDKRDISSADKSNYKVVKKGDLAYNSMRMWQGAVGVSDFDGIVSPAYTVVIPNNCHGKFFEYLFKTNNMLNKFQTHSQGLTSDTWNLKYPLFASIYINVPSLPEQQKIADFFSSLDSRISLAQKKLSALQHLKKGLMQQMFI